jgi:hypothetical protein
MGLRTSIWTHARARRWLGLHFERQLDPERETRLRRHLAGCVECRSLYMALALPETAQERHRRLEASLFGPDRAATERRTTPSSSGSRVLAWSAAAAAAVVVLAVLVLPPLLRGTRQTEFRARGALTSSEEPSASRFVSITVYRHPEQGAIEPVQNGDAIARGDRLAFAYTNRSEEGFDRLLLFGMDERHVVYWFYPAWTDPEQAPPRAVPIQRRHGVELPEEVAHDYEGSSLRLFALFFSKGRNLDVQTIETIVRQLKENRVRVESLRRFPLRETGQHTILLRVTDR